jgi:hypothetical protein
VSADYFQEIESHFAMRRGTPYLFNAKDWALLKSWQTDGIPLPVVIEALDTVFDKAAERGKVVNSLGYCRHAIKELWHERKELAIGAGTTPEESPAALLDALAAQFEASEHEVVRNFASRVKALESEKTVPRIEEALIALEEEVIAALATPELRAEAANLSANVDDRSRARTEEAHLRRLVRDAFAVPRLTLF